MSSPVGVATITWVRTTGVAAATPGTRRTASATSGEMPPAGLVST